LPKAHVIVYSRPGCHLCDEAKSVIETSGCTERFTFEEINIDGNLDLLAKFRFDIPVVFINGVEAFKHRVDSDEFRRRILATD
jgi:glutaredoxin